MHQVVHIQLHYVSSATSLYFPYDFCLYSEMTTLVSYSLRYTPFLLAIIISSILYTANRCIAWYLPYCLLQGLLIFLAFYRKFKLARNLRLSWSGLWLLMVLLSTDVVNTSVSILNCPILQDSNGKTSLVCSQLSNVYS